MKAPDKIYLTNGDREHLINFDSDVADGLVMWCEDKITDHDVEYIRKDLLMEWLAERKKHYQGLIPAEGAVAFICALDEVKHKIESI